MRLNCRVSEDGLTLIELLVTLGMISLVIAALYTFYLTGLKSWQRALIQLDSNQHGRIAMERIIKELRYAESFTLHSKGQEIRFQVPHEPLRTLRFRLMGRELVFDVYPTSSPGYFHTKIALDIDGLNFQIADHNLIKVKITTNESGAPLTLHGSVYPLNINRQMIIGEAVGEESDDEDID